MRFYIATKLENHVKHNAVRDVLVQDGHSITYDWTKHGPVYRHGLERVREVAEAETKGVLDADFVVVLWPSGRGTHVELGMALAANKPVVFYSEVEGHHVASQDTCAFYHHPLVARCRNAGELWDCLRRFNDPQQAAMPRTWEVAAGNFVEAFMAKCSGH